MAIQRERADSTPQCGKKREQPVHNLHICALNGTYGSEEGRKKEGRMEGADITICNIDVAATSSFFRTYVGTCLPPLSLSQRESSSPGCSWPIWLYTFQL